MTSIAFLGPRGTYSEEAARSAFLPSDHFESVETLSAVFAAVQEGRVEKGIVPVSNTLGGAVQESIEALKDDAFFIEERVSLLIHHCLLASPMHTKIQRIYAHEQALKQCKQWIATHYPDATTEALHSNAKAAEYVSKILDAAAIASRACEALYDLTVLAECIEDDQNNETEFVVFRYDPLKINN